MEQLWSVCLRRSGNTRDADASLFNLRCVHGTPFLIPQYPEDFFHGVQDPTFNIQQHGNMAEDAVSASAKGATFLILLQIGSRAITFVLNQYLLRFLSPELLGISTQLELFKIGTMYFSRESLRVAAERRSDGGVQASINLSYLAIFAGLPIGTILAEWYLRSSYAEIALFSQALRVNQLAAFVELLMEPAYTAVQHNLLYKYRAAAEGSSVVLKTLTVFSLVLWGRSRGIDLGVLPFAAGELVNSITLTSVYWILITPIVRKQGISLFPRKMVSRCVHTASRCKPAFR